MSGNAFDTFILGSHITRLRVVGLICVVSSNASEQLHAEYLVLVANRIHYEILHALIQLNVPGNGYVSPRNFAVDELGRLVAA